MYISYFILHVHVLYPLFLAHLAQRAIVSYCHTNASGVRRDGMCPSTPKNKYSNIFFCKTTGPMVLKFHMEHDLTPGSQNWKNWVRLKIQDGRRY